MDVNLALLLLVLLGINMPIDKIGLGFLKVDGILTNVE